MWQGALLLLPPTISYLSGNFGIVGKIGSSVKQSLFTIMTYLIGLFRYLFMFSIGPIRILSFNVIASVS